MFAAGTAKTMRRRSPPRARSSRADSSLAVFRAAEGQRAGDRLARVCAQSKDEGVVVDHPAVFEPDELPLGVDAHDRTAPEFCTRRLHQGAERKPAHLADVERLGYGKRSVGELLFGSDELDRDGVWGECAERERGLQGTNSCARDHNPKRHRPSQLLRSLAMVTPRLRCAIRAITDSTCRGVRKSRIVSRGLRRCAWTPEAADWEAKEAI